jgi:hypothetical protein
MFKSFDAAAEISSVTALKSSIVRGIKRSIVEMYPAMEPHIEDIIPKDGVKEGKGKDKLTFVVVEGTPLFFRVREGPYFPTLRLLHQCALLRCPAAGRVEEGGGGLSAGAAPAWLCGGAGCARITPLPPQPPPHPHPALPPAPQTP